MPTLCGTFPCGRVWLIVMQRRTQDNTYICRKRILLTRHINSASQIKITTSDHVVTSFIQNCVFFAGQSLYFFFFRPPFFLIRANCLALFIAFSLLSNICFMMLLNKSESICSCNLTWVMVFLL